MGIITNGESDALDELALGRNPSWATEIEVDNTDGTVLDGSYNSALDGVGPPAASGSGVDLLNTARAFVAIQLREDARFKTVRLLVDVYDATSDYEITLGSTSFTSGTTHTTQEEMVDDLVTNITAGGEPVTASREGSGSSSALLVQGDATADYAASAAAPTGGTGESSLQTDATSVEVKLHFAPKNWTGSNKWLGPSQTLAVTDTSGYLERFNVGGISECYPEFVSNDGKASVAIGPCVDT